MLTRTDVSSRDSIIIRSSIVDGDECNRVRPALVVGMVVGFVNAAEAKELLMDSGLVYITVAGRKGGSAVAAATVNALADLAANRG